MSTVVMPVRAMRCLCVKILVVTNAAGGINADLQVGDVMCIMDHFSLPCLVGQHPLLGPNDDTLGPRFVPTSNAYSKRLQEVVVGAAKTLGFNFVRPNGCYAMVSGPTYESTAEAKFLRQLGVDSVGMSTIPEVLAASHCGMKVIVLSLITNKVVMPGDDGPAASHQEVLEAVEQRATQMQDLVKQVVHDLQFELPEMPDLPEIDLAEAPGVHSDRTLWAASPLLVAALCGLAVGALASRAWLSRYAR